MTLDWHSKHDYNFDSANKWVKLKGKMKNETRKKKQWQT